MYRLGSIGAPAVQIGGITSRSTRCSRVNTCSRANCSKVVASDLPIAPAIGPASCERRPQLGARTGLRRPPVRRIAQQGAVPRWRYQPCRPAAVFFANARNLEALRKTVEDAASVSGSLWLSYLFTLFYLLVAADAVTRVIGRGHRRCDLTGRVGLAILPLGFLRGSTGCFRLR